jgi:hypothetical protein
MDAKSRSASLTAVPASPTSGGNMKRPEAAIALANEIAEYLKSLRLNIEATIPEEIEVLKRRLRAIEQQYQEELALIAKFEALLASDSTEGEAGAIKSGAVNEKLKKRFGI